MVRNTKVLNDYVDDGSDMLSSSAYLSIMLGTITVLLVDGKFARDLYRL